MQESVLHQYTIFHFVHVNRWCSGDKEGRGRACSKTRKKKQEPTPKRRKENPATKTPSRKSNAAKKWKALKPIQTPKQVSSTPDFELGPPAPGLSPSSCTKAVSSPIKKQQPDLEISLSGFLTDDSTQSETILSHKTPEKVSYFYVQYAFYWDTKMHAAYDSYLLLLIAYTFFYSIF